MNYAFRVMRPTSVARWEKRAPAAGGGRREPGLPQRSKFSSRVSTRKNFGYRQVARSETRRSLSPSAKPSNKGGEDCEIEILL